MHLISLRVAIGSCIAVAAVIVVLIERDRRLWNRFFGTQAPIRYRPAADDYNYVGMLHTRWVRLFWWRPANGWRVCLWRDRPVCLTLRLHCGWFGALQVGLGSSPWDQWIE
jgi:hypothetical protein